MFSMPEAGFAWTEARVFHRATIIAMRRAEMIDRALLVVVIGTALDFVPTILILTPVLVPVIKMAGIDPVFFGCSSS